MKNQILILSSVLFFNYALSQNSNTGIVYYDHIDNHYGVGYNSYLVFNENSSYFVTAKDSLGLSNNVTKANTNGEEEIIEAAEFNNVGKTRKDGLQVYLSKIDDSLYFVNAFSLTSKLIYGKEKIPKLKWELKNETKEIGGFKCKKAIANFRGRDFICWYAQEIPLPYGPWKLQGLPGIIMEAKTEDGFFEIKFKKIKYPEQNVSVPSSHNVLLKKDKEFISFKDYKRLQAQYIMKTDNTLKLLAKKHGVQVNPFSEIDNFLEVLGLE